MTKTANDLAAHAIRCRTAAVRDIAEMKLGLKTLKTRKSDQLDFSDQAVWDLKAALEAAFDAGRQTEREILAAS